MKKNIEDKLDSRTTEDKKSFFYDFNKKYIKFNDSTMVGLGGGGMIGSNFGAVGFILGALTGAAIFNYIDYKNKIDYSNISQQQ